MNPSWISDFFPWIYSSLSQQKHYYSLILNVSQGRSCSHVKTSDSLLPIWPFQRVAVHCIHVTTLTNWYHPPHTVHLILKYNTIETGCSERNLYIILTLLSMCANGDHIQFTHRLAMLSPVQSRWQVNNFTMN